MNVLRAALTVGSLTLVSRILGFVRDAMIAAVLGASVLADAFFVSFKLANLFRRLVAEGAFNASFVPLFARMLDRHGPAAAKRFAQDVLAVLTVFVLVLVLGAELVMPWLVRILASGFAPDSDRFRLAVELSRITFPYLAFVALGALFGGILNALGRFGAAAAAPIILNIVLILALLLGHLHPKSPAHALAWGVAIAGVIQLLYIVIFARRLGYGLRLMRPRLTVGVRRLLYLALPGLVGVGVYQINLIIGTWFATHLPSGSVSYLFYADRLNQLPLGLIGVALGTVLLPTLARDLRSGRHAAAMEAQNRAIEVGMLLTLPAAVALVVIAGPITATLFERGAFDAQAAQATAGALAGFSLGLPAYVLIKVLAPVFFAREDTRTPVVVAAICLVGNILLVGLLIGPLAHVGIAVATAVTNWLNALLLLLLLRRKGDFVSDARLRRRLPRMMLAAAGMGLFLHFCPFGALIGPAPVRLVLICLGGGLIFLGLAQLLGGTDLRELKAQLAG